MKGLFGRKGSKAIDPPSNGSKLRTASQPQVEPGSGRLTRYSQRVPATSQAQPDNSDTSGSLRDANGGDVALVSRTQSQTSAQRYKTSIMNRQQQDEPDVASESGDASRIKTYRKPVNGLASAANGKGTTAPQLPPLDGLSVEEADENVSVRNGANGATNGLTNGANGYGNGNGIATPPTPAAVAANQAAPVARSPAAPQQQPAQAEQRSSTLNPASAVTAPRKAARKVQVTPEQRHYLVRALVSLQMANESRDLEKIGGLTFYGHPFAVERPKLKRLKKDLENEYTAGGDMEEIAEDPYGEVDEDVVRRSENVQEPVILRHLYHANLLPFPGLDTAPLKYWQTRIQPFFDEMAARNFSTSMERGELSQRRFFSLAAVRYLSVYFARGLNIRGEGELRGPGVGDPGTEKWGIGKQWGKGTVKRGLAKPLRIDDRMMQQINDLFDADTEEGKQWRLAGKETNRVRTDWRAFKEFVIENEDGLDETNRYLEISTIKNLPAHYRNAEEFARNHAAYIFHTLFVSSPDADSTFKVLKGIHALFPYWGAKQLLKFANAQLMIQGILSLLLARPAGAKSLIQRVFTYVIGREASSIGKEYIEPLKKAINDQDLAKLVIDYIKRGSRPERRAIRSKTIKSGHDVLAVLLLEGNHAKPSEETKQRILAMQHAFGRSNYRGHLDDAFPDGTPVAAERKTHPSSGLSGQEAEMARQFAMLKLLLRMCSKKRDREQASAMASGSLIPTITKDTLETVFYQPIKMIASTANLSGRLGDLQAFLDDMIKVKQAGDNSLQAWIALCARHEQSLYYLFHECQSIAQPFFDWLQLGTDYMALGTSDPSHPDDRKARSLEINVEELLADERLSDEDVKRILREVDGFMQWNLWQKVWYELEMRKNFLLAKPDTAAASGLGEDALPSGAFKTEIQDLDSLMKDLLEANGAKINDGLCRSEARGTEARDLPWLYFDEVDPCSQHLMGEEDVADLKYEPPSVNFPPPNLLHTRKALPIFRSTLLSQMPDRFARKPGRPTDTRRNSTVSTSTRPAKAADAKSTADAKSFISRKSGFRLPFMSSK